ncbi:response regulator [Rhizorhabdus sp. FW153]|uniref:response regulator n=1 Tax=Rhizorhabdus sp. FW153 TaxID=3400216 RepID=UPI003CE949E9
MRTPPASDRRPVILVVEDEAIVRLLAVEAIEEAGYAAVEAEDAEEALRMLESREIDAVFTDVRMPGAMDGQQLAAHVRRDHPDLPILVTSGHRREECASATPGVLFLQKPYRAAILIATLNALLASRAAAGYSGPS